LGGGRGRRHSLSASRSQTPHQFLHFSRTTALAPSIFLFACKFFSLLISCSSLSAALIASFICPSPWYSSSSAATRARCTLVAYACSLSPHHSASSSPAFHPLLSSRTSSQPSSNLRPRSVATSAPLRRAAQFGLPTIGFSLYSSLPVTVLAQSPHPFPHSHLRHACSTPALRVRALR